MSIDIEKAVSFIGYPVTYPELDDFLQASGVKRRLSAKDRPQATIDTESDSVHLHFTDSYAKTHGMPKTDGFLFLEDVTVDNSKYEPEAGEFTGSLPFGLRLDMNEADILATMGTPVYNGEFFGARFINYADVYPGVHLKFRLDRNTREITFIRFSAKELA